MRLRVEVDDQVLHEVMNLGGFSSKKTAVNTALLEFSRALKRRQLLALQGKVKWRGDLEALRQDRSGRTTKS